MKLWNERIKIILPRMKGPDVLHVGCVGEGGERFLVHSALCESLPAYKISGVDINADGVKELQARGFEAVVGDAESMELGRQFDTIFAGELIEHLANPGRFLDRCRGMLKPQGKLLLSTPNPFSVEHVGLYIKNFRRAFHGGHALWMCPQTLEQIARRSGLKLVELIFVDNLFPEFVTSKWSKTFAVIWKIARPLLPRRFRNTMVAVFEPL
jgi:2-polyprenyl-3-methyl-5-hydroxy-6-metoxy-1,4-benzoquinol methylase